jgi:ATP-dependent exoDNAse (exonuclease V) beta subunit
LFIVGDAKQSIYDFRGAEVEVFGQAREAADEKISLDINFRSLPGILEFVNEFFQESGLIETEGIQYHPLHAHRETREEPRVEFLLAELNSEKPLAQEARTAEADLIAARIAEMCSDPSTLVLDSSSDEWRPAAYGDVVLLFRASSDISLYEEALRRQQIPFNVAEGAGFYERQEISDIRNLLTVLVDPWNEMALFGFLRSPIGALSDESLMALSAERGLADSFQSDLSLEEVDQNERLNRARTLIAQLRARADSPLPSLLRHVITETGYDAILLAGRHGRQKVSNLRKLLDLAEGFSKTRPPRLPAFVRYLEDVASRALREGDAPLPGEGEDSVTLMTIHKAKGLEFSIVVLADTARSTKGKTNMDAVRFHRRLGLVASCTDDVGVGQKPLLWKSIDRAEQDTRRAEEARVLYVALTRARDWLLIAGAPAAAKSDSWLHAFEEVYGLSGYGDGEVIIGEGWSGVVRRRAGTTPKPRPRQPAESTFSMDDMEKRVSPIIVPSRSGSTLSVTQLVHLMDGGSTEDAALETKPSQGGKGGGSVALLRGTMAHALFEGWDFGVEDPAIVPILIEFAPGLRDPDGHGVYLAGLAERFAQTELFGELSRAESLERELPFVWTIGGQPVSGTVDMVLDGSGIVDYKTGRFRAESHIRYERQVQLYALAMHSLTGIRASSAILQYVDETEGRREVDVSEDALAEVLALAEKAVAPLAVPE